MARPPGAQPRAPATSCRIVSAAGASDEIAVRSLICLASATWITFWLAGCFAGPEAMHDMRGMAAEPKASDAEMAALVERRCTACHPVGQIFSAVGTPEDWHAVIHRMVYHHKAKLITHITDEEAAAIAAWLAATRTPDRPGARVGYLPSGRPL
jgi:hypothetical protein